VFGSVGRDTQYKGSIGRHTDNLCRAQGKGWIRSGNDRRELSRNPTTACRKKGCPQFAINECEEHSKLRLDTVTVGVDLGRTEKLRFLIDTGAKISIVKGARLRPEIVSPMKALM
jgi:hypothetical protein